MFYNTLVKGLTEVKRKLEFIEIKTDLKIMKIRQNMVFENALCIRYMHRYNYLQISETILI